MQPNKAEVETWEDRKNLNRQPDMDGSDREKILGDQESTEEENHKEAEGTTGKKTEGRGMGAELGTHTRGRTEDGDVGGRKAVNRGGETTHTEDSLETDATAKYGAHVTRGLGGYGAGRIELEARNREPLIINEGEVKITEDETTIQG